MSWYWIALVVYAVLITIATAHIVRRRGGVREWAQNYTYERKVNGETVVMINRRVVNTMIFIITIAVFGVLFLGYWIFLLPQLWRRARG